MLGASADQHPPAAFHGLPSGDQQAVAGAGALTIAGHDAFKWDYPTLPVVQRVGSGMDENEARAVNERPLFFRREMLSERVRIRCRARDRDRLVEMQLAGAAVVVEPIGDVGVLLELQ